MHAARGLRHARGERKLGRRARRAIEPADIADDRTKEVVVDLSAGDEGSKVDRSGGEAEKNLAVDFGGEFASRDRCLEHRGELAHAGVEIGAGIIDST